MNYELMCFLKNLSQRRKGAKHAKKQYNKLCVPLRLCERKKININSLT